ncbi:hypothetical protein PoB_007297200 [Plakobranchus ocellatus]|uniref:Clathrin light chain n=1 Tax=Plakobranchus ocellatus TaxID=259542 RepID=A0AAV4DQC5_9GAST|nr:hypothetical protein PoB_007297200 [Plakobranchus ocellatus]
MDPFDTSLFEPPPDTLEDGDRPTGDRSDDLFRGDPFGDISGDDIFAPAAATVTASSAAAAVADVTPPSTSGKPGDSSDLLGLDKDEDWAAGTGNGMSEDVFGGPVNVQDLDDLFGPPPIPASTSASDSRSADFITASGTASDRGSLFDDILDLNFGGTNAPAETAGASATALGPPSVQVMLVIFHSNYAQAPPLLPFIDVKCSIISAESLEQDLNPKF